MSTTLTIRLDDKLDRALTRFARVVLPFAEARGLLTDEDVFAAVS